MTTYTIPTEDVLREVHRIAGKHGMRFDIERLVGPSPFEWRVALGKPDEPCIGIALHDITELPEAIVEVWKQCLTWGLA